MIHHLKDEAFEAMVARAEDLDGDGDLAQRNEDRNVRAIDFTMIDESGTLIGVLRGADVDPVVRTDHAEVA